jgi:putative mycofactocin binding protein MftB
LASADPQRRYALSPDAVIRRERFGGLVYRYDNRRLYFVHSKAMADFLEGLDGESTLEGQLDAFFTERALPDGQRPLYLSTLAKLQELEVVREL